MNKVKHLYEVKFTSFIIKGDLITNIPAYDINDAIQNFNMIMGNADHAHYEILSIIKGEV